MSNARPWERKAPKKATITKLTPAQKEEARARALKAGRRYPNLVDNLAVLRRGKGSAGLRTERRARRTP